MENNSFLDGNRLYSREAAGVSGNPYLAAGLLLGYFALGLASFIWAFWSQRSRLNFFKESLVLSFSGQQGSLRGAQNTHSCLLSLLVMGVFNAITAVILAIEFATSNCNSSLSCEYVFVAWFLSKSYQEIFHLLCALVAVMFLSQPQSLARLRCISTVVALLILALVPFYVFLSWIAIFLLAFIMFGLALSIIAKCATSARSSSAAAAKKPFVFVAMLVFLIVYLPSFILQCLLIAPLDPIDDYLTVYVNVLFFTNIQLFLDGLLCFFILRLPAEEEEQGTLGEPN